MTLSYTYKVYPYFLSEHGIVRRIPAAIAEPITPATLGPIECMRRKLLARLRFAPITTHEVVLPYGLI